LASLGYHDEYIEGYKELTKIRASIGDLLLGYKRGHITESQVKTELMRQGVADDAIELVVQNTREVLDVQTMLTAWHRGELDETDVRDELRTRQYSDDDIDIILSLSHPIPGPGDQVRFAVREAFRDDIAQQWHYDEDMPTQFTDAMAQLGFDEKWARYYWRAHWALPSVSQGFEMLHRGAIDEDELQTLLRVLDLPERWRQGLTDISWTPFTRVDVRRMYALGVLTEEEVKESYKAIGYDDDKAEKMTQFTILYQTGNDTNKLDEYKELTRSVVIQAFQKGIIDQSEATTRLMDIGYFREDIELLLDLV